MESNEQLLDAHQSFTESKMNFSDIGSLSGVFEDDDVTLGDDPLIKEMMHPSNSSQSRSALSSVPEETDFQQQQQESRQQPQDPPQRNMSDLISPSSTCPCITPHENDVLLGRGGRNNQWSGNETLRTLAREMSDAYKAAPKRNKPAIAWMLVTKIRSLTPAGRFLKQEQGGEWHEVDDEVAREKASQCLRDIVSALSKGNLKSLGSTVSAQSMLDVDSGIRTPVPMSNATFDQPNQRPNFTALRDELLQGREKKQGSDESSLNCQSSLRDHSQQIETHQPKHCLSKDRTIIDSVSSAGIALQNTLAAFGKRNVVLNRAIERTRNSSMHSNTLFSNPLSTRKVGSSGAKRTFAQSAPDLGDIDLFSKRVRSSEMKNATFTFMQPNVFEPSQLDDFSEDQPLLHRKINPLKSVSCIALGAGIALPQHSGAVGGYQGNDPFMRQYRSLTKARPSLGSHSKSNFASVLSNFQSRASGLENFNWNQSTEPSTPRLGESNQTHHSIFGGVMPQSQRQQEHTCFEGMGAVTDEDDDTALQRWIDRMAEEEL